ARQPWSRRPPARAVARRDAWPTKYQRRETRPRPGRAATSGSSVLRSGLFGPYLKRRRRQPSIGFGEVGTLPRLSVSSSGKTMRLRFALGFLLLPFAAVAAPPLPTLPGATGGDTTQPQAAPVTSVHAAATDKVRKGVVTVEAGGRVIAIGTVLGTDGRVLT